MSNEKREWQRYHPEGLTAHIVINIASDSEIVIDGDVVDISYTGIKIKLSKPLTHIIDQGKLVISITLPQSKVPIQIHGTIKHIANKSEFGLQYHNNQPELDIDDLMFECIKLVPTEKRSNL